MRNLTTTNANAVTLTGPETVMQVLTVGAAGNLVLNGQTLTLPSSAAGTALVVNSGSGTVQGNTALVQRYIDPSVNGGLGYRHYSAPVAATTVADLATGGFSPTLNAAYNTSARPDLVTPFPTVYNYDQSRLATVTNNYSAFDKGWVSPSGTGDALAVGLGYTVNISASEKVDFAGTLNSGDLTVPLARNSGATATDAGWALVGNPYPAPLDWNAVAPADRPGLDAAMYVFESAGQYTGSYRANVNGVGGNANSGSSLIGSSQGFFVRVSAGQTSGSLTFRNSQRITSYASQVPLRRGTADTRPLVQLTLQGSSGLADALFVYAESGATDALDSQFDAVKLPNSTGLNLAAAPANSPTLAIDGRDQFTTATVVPLSIGVPAAGTYHLKAEQLLNLTTNLVAYLFDAQTNQLIDLSQQPGYSFTVTTQQAMQAQANRFQLRFGSAAGPLATNAAKAGVEVVLYPNPARSSFIIALPANITGPVAGQATLFNSLGQAVRANIPLSATGASTTVDVADLAKGVYTLRMQVGATAIAKQVVVQ